MNTNDFISIGELAKFSRVTRTTLIHYDKIGVLKPIYIGENNYRYYSFDQISWVNLIRTMQTIGMSLKDIINIMRQRTPETILKLFVEQTCNINQIITNRLEARKLLLTLQTTIEQSIAMDEKKIELMWEDASNILLGPQNYYDGGKTDWDALLDFYNYCKKKYAHLNLNYPAWGFFSGERIKNGDWKYPDRFYMNSPDGEDKKPAGLYAVGYGRGGYGKTDEIYRRMMRYISENRLEICGPVYEAYPLNEISIPNPTNYLIRISITVKKK